MSEIKLVLMGCCIALFFMAMHCSDDVMPSVDVVFCNATSESVIIYENVYDNEDNIYI